MALKHKKCKFDKKLKIMILKFHFVCIIRNGFVCALFYLLRALYEYIIVVFLMYCTLIVGKSHIFSLETSKEWSIITRTGTGLSPGLLQEVTAADWHPRMNPGFSNVCLPPEHKYGEKHQARFSLRQSNKLLGRAETPSS